MQPIKRWIYLGFSLCLLMFTGMQAWGSPFSGFSAFTALLQEPQQQPQPDQPKQDSAKAVRSSRLLRRGLQAGRRHPRQAL
jgi:hypothetical protein